MASSRATIWADHSLMGLRRACGRDGARSWLRLLGLSEIYPFNDWNEKRRAAVAALIEEAAAAGAETVSLIPRVDLREPDDAATRAASLSAVLTEVAPMLEGTRVIALLEPIGFATCSMKFQREAAAAIESLSSATALA